MTYRKKSTHHSGFGFLAAAAVLSFAVAACSDDDDGVGGGEAGSGGKTTAGSGGKSTAGSAGKSTAGSGGSTAGSNGTAGSAGNNGTAGSAGTAGTGGVGGTENGTGGDGPLGGDGPMGGSGGSDGGSGGEGGNPNPAETALVFGDDYAAGVGFVAFGGSTNDVTVDTSTYHAGNASLKIVVPAGGYTGGALVASAAADLSTHNAISFWAKASAAHTFDKVGFGNDAAGGVALQVERLNLALTTEWQHFIVPIPAPSKLTSEVGLFHFAEGGEDYTVWLDSIDYVTVNNLGTPSPSIKTETRDITVDGTFTIADTAVSYTVDAAPIALAVSPAWFDYESADDNIASVSLAGVVTGEAVGSADITAKLGAIDATGTVTVNVTEVSLPEVAAPTPATAEANVLSLFSDAYTNVAVATWSAGWDNAGFQDITVAGNATKEYTSLVVAGIDFGTTYDLTTYTHLHVDVWLPVATSFSLKLVDFGANGNYQGGDDSEGTAQKTGLTTKEWQSLDFDLTAFPGLAARAHLAQILVLGSSSETVYIDNVYFYK